MNEPDPIRVAIVEDDRMTREGLRMLVDGTPGYRCNAAFGSLEQALATRGAEPPDVVLLDIKLPGMPGSEGVASLREKWPQAAVLMLTAFTDEDKVFESLCNGAIGYLLKSTPPARILEAVREARHGGSPMSPEIARKVVELFRRNPPPVALEEALTLRRRSTCCASSPKVAATRFPAISSASASTPCATTFATFTRSSRSTPSPRPSVKPCGPVCCRPARPPSCPDHQP